MRRIKKLPLLLLLHHFAVVGCFGKSAAAYLQYSSMLSLYIRYDYNNDAVDGRIQYESYIVHRVHELSHRKVQLRNGL